MAVLISRSGGTCLINITSTILELIEPVLYIGALRVADLLRTVQPECDGDAGVPVGLGDNSIDI